MKLEKLKKLLGDVFAEQLNELIKAQRLRAKRELWEDLIRHMTKEKQNLYVIGQMQLFAIKKRHFRSDSNDKEDQGS